MNNCPCNWNYFDGRCYYVSTTTAATWLAARADCRARGGDLAVPTSSSNNYRIYEAIKSRNIGRAFIGLYRVDKNLGSNKFYNVRGIEAGYSNWHSGQPSNSAGGIEACTEVMYKSPYFNSGRDVVGTWNDLPCSGFPRHYVCQISFQKYDN